MPESSPPFFTPAQRRLVGFAVGLIALLAIVTLLVAVVVVFSRMLGVFSSIIWPLAAAGIFALMLRPVVGLIERWLHLSRILSVLVLYALVAIVLATLLLIFVPQLIRQIVDLINAAPQLWTRATESFNRVYPSWVELYNRAMENPTLRGLLEGALTQLRTIAPTFLPDLESAGGTVMGVFGFVSSLATVPVFLFFFLQSDEDPSKALHEFLPFFKDETRDDVVFLAREFLAIVVAFFRGQLVIGLIMGVLLAIGFTAVGLKFGVVFGLFAGLLNIVPYLGTILGLATVLPTAYFEPGGGIIPVGLCLGVFILVQCIEGYFLTPRIMGRQTGLHPAVVIVAIFFWGIALNGILGMILAIPLTAFLVTVWRLAKRKYIRQVV